MLFRSEAARFERSNVRRTSHKIGLRSDSSARFEKGVDWQSAELGSARALALIDELKCGVIDSAVVSDGITAPENKVIRTSKEQICSLLGIDIDKKVMVSILKKQGITVKTEGKTLVCTIPLYREDIDGYPDLAEDIMRFYGYDNIVSTHSENTHQTRGYINTHDADIQAIKDRLSALGVDETLNYSFVSPDVLDKLLIPSDSPLRKEIPILNPLSRDISVMRTQLVSSMLASVARNCARKNDTMRFYELGKVFVADSLPLTKLPQERDTLCIAVCNDGDFYTLKAIVGEMCGLFGTPNYTVSSAPYLHPKQSLHVECGGIKGDFGKLHPIVCENFDIPSEVYVAQLDIADALSTQLSLGKYTGISKLQPVDRDLAVVVEKSVAVGDMLAAVKSANEHIYSVKLFDIYDGEQIAEGYKSVAFSVRLQPINKTFSDDEIKSVMDTVLQKITAIFGARLR